MRKKKELTWLYDKLRLPPEGRRLVEHIRHSPPERATEGGRHNVHGSYPSKKMGCTIQFESNNCELGYVIQTEFDAEVREYYCQPHALKHIYLSKLGKKIAHYETTDYLEISEKGISFISCKKEAELLELSSENPSRYVRDESGKWRCPPGEEAASEYGLGFRVVSSAELNPCFLQNLEFLADYIQERVVPLPETTETINAFFAERSFGNLIDLIKNVGSADEVYRAVVTGHLYFEWESEFLSQTHSAMVFRDCVSAKAYRCVMTHRYFDPAPQIETLALKPGSSVAWDGIAWEVLNVGVDTVTLAHAKNVAPLPKPHFFELVNKGHIKGAVIERDPRFDAAMERLLTASPLALNEAWRRYDLIAPRLGRPVLEIHAGDDQARNRTVREYLKRWADCEVLYLDGFIGLIPNYASQGNRNPKLPARTIKLAKAVIRKYWLKEKAPVKQNTWLRFKKIAKRLQISICSDKTFYGLFAEVRLKEATEARHGHKAAYQVAGPLWDGDPALFAKHGDRAFAVAHIDHTEVDLEFLSSVTRVNLGKAWLTLLIDAYTRVVLACYLSFDRPSYVACMMAMRTCVSRHGRLPDVIVSDQGKEFRCRCFRRLAARHGCTLKYRPKSEPRFGAIVERAFGSLNTRLINNLEGNTQNSKKPRESAKSHAPTSRAVWTVPRFIPFLERFLYDVLPSLDHFGLLRTPKAIFEESLALHGLREGRRLAYSEAFIFDSLPTPSAPEKRRVHGRKGISVNYLTYWSRELRDPKVIGTKVHVKFDPFDAGHIWAYVKNRWIRCECTSTLFRRIPVGEVMWAVAQIKEDARRTGRNYRINTQVLEDFFFTLTRGENGLIAEKKRIQQAMQAVHLTHARSSDEQVDQPGTDAIDSGNAVASIPHVRKPLKSVHVKTEVTAR